jgi:hypothetical protein
VFQTETRVVADEDEKEKEDVDEDDGKESSTIS